MLDAFRWAHYEDSGDYREVILVSTFVDFRMRVE